MMNDVKCYVIATKAIARSKYKWHWSTVSFVRHSYIMLVWTCCILWSITLPIIFVEIYVKGYSSRPLFVSQCFKLHSVFHCDASRVVTHNDDSHYTANIQAVLAWQDCYWSINQHLEERFACLEIWELQLVSENLLVS